MTSIATKPVVDSEARSLHKITTLPILVLFPHSRCNCRCVMCDIWRIRQVREITPDDLKPHLESFRFLKVRWVVFSGGEPLMHSDLGALSRLLRGEGIRLTLLTAGLLLERQARLVAENVDDVIVSLDGPPEIHNQIRAVPHAFDRLRRGIEAVRRLRPDMPITARCTVQKSNFRHLRAAVQTAQELGLNSISFLGVDLTSSAFNRPEGWPPERSASVALAEDEVKEMAREMEALINACQREIASGYVVESPEKLRRMVHHFRAHLGQVPATAPRCNAPWVSAVVEADGSVRPCFFHPAYGDIRTKPLEEVLNSERALDFRRSLDVPSNPVCRRCVCSLYVPEVREASRRAR